MTTTNVDTPSPETPEIPERPKMGTKKRMLIATALGVAALVAGLLMIFNSGTARDARAEVDFLTEIESTFGTPQFDGLTINGKGRATLRDAYIACAVGSNIFMKDWRATGLPEGPGLLFLEVVESSDICNDG